MDERTLIKRKLQIRGHDPIEFSEDDELVLEGGFNLNNENKDEYNDEDAYLLKLQKSHYK